MQINHRPSPAKAFSWKALTTRAKYGTSMIRCVQNPRSGRFFACLPRNWIAVPGIFVQPGMRRFGSMEGSFRVAP